MTTEQEELLAKISAIVNKTNFSPVQSQDLFEAFLRAKNEIPKLLELTDTNSAPSWKLFQFSLQTTSKLMSLLLILKYTTNFTHKKSTKTPLIKPNLTPLSY